MARANDVDGSGNGGKDPVSVAVHALGNALHALSLRLLLLEGISLGSPAKGHVQEANRLARQSSQLLAELRRLRDQTPAPAGGGRLTRHGNPR